MKISTASLAFVGPALASTVSAKDCDIAKLLGLANGPNLLACSSDSGLSLSSGSTPSAEELEKICASSSCMAFLESLTDLQLGDCTVPGSEIRLGSDVLDPIALECSSDNSSSTTSSLADKEVQLDGADGNSKSADDQAEMEDGAEESTMPSTSGVGSLCPGVASTLAMALLASFFW